MPMISAVPIEGLSVYGTEQVAYRVSSSGTGDLISAAFAAMAMEACAIEAEAGAYADVLRLRRKKLEDLGVALAAVAKARASLNVEKGAESSDLSSADSALQEASRIAALYRRTEGSSLVVKVNSENKIRRDDALMAESAIQYEIDYETNEMRQDMVVMQSLVSKRDNAFSTVARLVEKLSSTAKSIIANIGRDCC